MSRAEYMRQYRRLKREQKAAQGVTPNKSVTPEPVTQNSAEQDDNPRQAQKYTYQSGRWTRGGDIFRDYSDFEDFIEWLDALGFGEFEEWGTPAVRELEVYKNPETDEYIALIVLANCCDVRFVFVPSFEDLMEFLARYTPIFNNPPPYEH